MASRFTAVYERHQGKMWQATLAEEPRVASNGSSLARAREAIRVAIALWFHIEDADFEVVDQVVLSEHLEAQVASVLKARYALQSAKDDYNRIVRDAARSLVREGEFTLRDAAEVLDLSHQRIRQLVEHHPS